MTADVPEATSRSSGPAPWRRHRPGRGHRRPPGLPPGRWCEPGRGRRRAPQPAAHRPRRQGPAHRRPGPGRRGPAACRQRPSRPPRVARGRGGRRGPRGQTVGVRRAEPAAAPHRAARHEYLEPRHRRHRRGGARPGARHRLHFFNPAPVMRLVEVVHGTASAKTYVDFAADLVAWWGKTPSTAHPRPGSSSTGWRARSTARGSGCSRRASPTPPRSTPASAPPGSGWARSSSPTSSAKTSTSPSAPVSGSGPARTPGMRRCSSSVTLSRRDTWAQDRPRDLHVYAGRSPHRGGHRRDPRRGLVGGPVRTDPVARTVAMLVNEAVDLVHRGEATRRMSTPPSSAPRPQGPHRLGARLGHERFAASSELDDPYPGGRYRPTPPWRPRADEQWSHEGPRSGLRRGPRSRPPDVGRRPRVGAPRHGGHRRRGRPCGRPDDRGRAHGQRPRHRARRLPVRAGRLGVRDRLQLPGRATVAAGADIVFVASARLGDVLVAEAQVRTAYGRSGVTDVTVTRESDGAVIAEFRGRSRSLPSR